MGLNILNLSTKDAARDLENKFLNPFKPGITPEEIRSAHAINDFKKGFIINELINNTFAPTDAPRRDDIVLLSDAMPQVPFSFGGKQQLVKDYYPGNSEPTVQVLGPRETNITIRGRFKSKRFKPADPKTGFTLGGGIDNALGAAGVSTTGQDPEKAEAKKALREYPAEMVELFDAMRIRGNLVRLTMGAFQRFGFIEETKFDLQNLADISYEVTFLIIGINPPIGCKIAGRARTEPIDINKELIAAAQEFQANANNIPGSMPRSIADQISDAIGLVADSINLVTNYIDSIFDEVDDIKSAVARGNGLIKHSRNQINTFQRRLGGYDSFGDIAIASGGGIASGYSNAGYLTATFTSTFSLVSLLASLSDQLSQIAATEPLARHRIREGDTLQKLAIKFYDEAEQWKEIFDHNKLQSTDLSASIGEILEIPRIDN
jgi:hypothetical protein